MSKVATVLRVVSGNLLEMYDFMVYGYYAEAISATFFPSDNHFVSLMAGLMTFGVGFLMRPLGALILGAYIDRHGRRQGLIVTLGLMALGSLLIACVPGYATIGVLAPIIVVVGRLLQGFSAGVELGGVSVYLAEMATPGHRGFYVSWQSASQQVAVVAAGAIGYFLHTNLSPEQMSEWGWRVPFWLGCIIVPFLFFIRRSLEETEEFQNRKERPQLPEIFQSIRENAVLVGLGTMMVMMTTVSFYIITAYTPTFGKELNLPPLDFLTVTVAVGVSNFFWLPVMGALSDRVGRQPLLRLFSLLMALTGYPALAWVASEPSLERLLAVDLWLSFLYASYNGAMVVALTEIMPVKVRTAGFALAYSTATAIFGGFTPAICTFLIGKTGHKASPGWWLTLAAVCSFIASRLVHMKNAPGVVPDALSVPRDPGFTPPTTSPEAP